MSVCLWRNQVSHLRVLFTPLVPSWWNYVMDHVEYKYKKCIYSLQRAISLNCNRNIFSHNSDVTFCQPGIITTRYSLFDCEECAPSNSETSSAWQIFRSISWIKCVPPDLKPPENALFETKHLGTLALVRKMRDINITLEFLSGDFFGCLCSFVQRLHFDPSSSCTSGRFSRHHG